MVHKVHHKAKKHPLEHIKIDLPIFLNVILASIVVGGLCHEVIHIIFLPYTTSLTIDFSNPAEILYVCCFQTGEDWFEYPLSLFVQFVAMVFWIYINRKSFLKEFPHQKND